MTDTGWIIVGIIALAAILLVALMLRRKPGGAVPVEPVAEALIPEQVKPEPTVIAEPPPPPQTLAAEEGPAPAPEPVIVQPEPESPAAPVVVSTPPAPVAAAPVGDGDNLLKLKGVGPKIAALLRAEGVTRYAQVAAWTDADLAAIDAKLGSFAGRPKRDNWVDQAAFLAAGDVAGYEAKYGKL